MKNTYQIILSIVSGLLVSLSFPVVFYKWEMPNLGWVVFFALIPLLAAIRQETPRRAFLFTFVASVIWYGTSVFWVYNAMHVFGELPVFSSVLVTVLLVIIISAYISLAPLFTRLTITRWRGDMMPLLPVFWVAFEILRNYVPCNGFPWSNLAMSQYRHLHFIQIADLIGVYGVIFVIVWVNVAGAEVVARLKGEFVSMFKTKIVVTLVILALVFTYGFFRLASVEKSIPQFPSFSVGLIQGNIPQDKKWDEKSATENLEVYRAGAKKLLEADVELLMWTEASFPWIMKTTDTEIEPKFLGLPSDLKTKLPYTLLGAVSKNSEGDYYNSAALFNAQGNIDGLYHKAHLVPFGEYIPYQKLFFFAKKLTEPVGNFLSGTSYDPLVAGAAKMAILICYEDIFPEISRKAVLRGANFLANITNDGWFGHFGMQRQHMALSVFRAIENRRFLVRSNNSGISAFIMPTGASVVESTTFEKALLVSPITLMDTLTPYTKLGDWFAWGCLAYLVLCVLVVVYRKIVLKRRYDEQGTQGKV